MTNKEYAEYIKQLAADLKEAGSPATAAEFIQAADRIEKLERQVDHAHSLISGIKNNTANYLKGFKNEM